MDQIQVVQPVSIDGLHPRRPAIAAPTFEWVRPETLWIDASYQRAISERGHRQIRKTVQEFCWSRFKPPVCAYGEVGGRRVLMVLDGQHTAIATASNPHVREIPVMVVNAPGKEAQAAAFVGQNTDRLGVTPLQLHRASVVAGDEDALTVEQVCERAGVTVLKANSSASRYKAGETIAVNTIATLVKRNTALVARQILEVLARAELAPITGHHIRAAEYLMTNKDYRQKFDAEDLAIAIGEAFLTVEDEARVFSQRIPYWKALAVLWFRRTKKRRSHLRAVA